MSSTPYDFGTLKVFCEGCQIHARGEFFDERDVF